MTFRIPKDQGIWNIKRENSMEIRDVMVHQLMKLGFHSTYQKKKAWVSLSPHSPHTHRDIDRDIWEVYIPWTHTHIYIYMGFIPEISPPNTPPNTPPHPHGFEPWASLNEERYYVFTNAGTRGEKWFKA